VSTGSLGWLTWNGRIARVGSVERLEQSQQLVNAARTEQALDPRFAQWTSSEMGEHRERDRVRNDAAADHAPKEHVCRRDDVGVCPETERRDARAQPHREGRRRRDLHDDCERNRRLPRHRLDTAQVRAAEQRGHEAEQERNQLTPNQWGECAWDARVPSLAQDVG
jgi:hypothetical protein